MWRPLSLRQTAKRRFIRPWALDTGEGLGIWYFPDSMAPTPHHTPFVSNVTVIFVDVLFPLFRCVLITRQIVYLKTFSIRLTKTKIDRHFPLTVQGSSHKQRAKVKIEYNKKECQIVKKCVVVMRKTIDDGDCFPFQCGLLQNVFRHTFRLHSPHVIKFLLYVRGKY